MIDNNMVGQLTLPAKDQTLHLEDHTPLVPSERAAQGLLRQALSEPRFRGSVPQDIRVYHTPEKRPLMVIAGLERSHHGLLLHVSMSYAHQVPRYKVVRMVKDVFFPRDVDAMMVLPRQQDYVNAMDYCLHVWQCPTGWRVQ